jgi:HAD superfamily hydrolase (TIGR01662 family)
VALRAVLFDLDDTLIDWSGFSGDWQMMERPHLAGVMRYIHQQGYAPSTVDAENELDALIEQYAVEFRTRTMDAWKSANETLEAPHLGRMLVHAAEVLGVPPGVLDPDACLRAYNWAAPAGTVAFPEVVDVLPMLRAAGLHVAIVTNAYQPMWLRDIEMQHHGILDHFVDCRVSAADVGVLKPHPRIFQTALDCLGVTAAEAVFVGDDADADIVGARAVGMRAVLRRTRRYRDEMAVLPDATISTLHELLPLFDTWFPGWRLV